MPKAQVRTIASCTLGYCGVKFFNMLPTEPLNPKKQCALGLLYECGLATGLSPERWWLEPLIVSTTRTEFCLDNHSVPHDAMHKRFQWRLCIGTHEAMCTIIGSVCECSTNSIQLFLFMSHS